jgi:PadR family transcriptional regulator PadR
MLPGHMTREDIPQGTLDMLILRTLATSQEGQLHGFEIASAIETVSSSVFVVEEGSLYPALQRMLVQGWIAGEWGRTADNRRARYYRVTASGRKQLERAMKSYDRVSQAIAAILNITPRGT